MTEAAGGRDRALGRVLLLTLLGCLVAAFFGRRLPAALPADAPPELFSAGRARELLGRIARAPHPVGSDEHERVRELLLEHLRALGFEPEEHTGVSYAKPLANLLVHVPGRDSTGTVLCLAHYDSVPTGPGASDDGLGVVAWLEALRALRARGWQPRNDVALLLSDGEELGLLGAQIFVREHPLAQDVRTVVNLEAIGNGGPAVLFELGPGNGARLREFARAVSAPTGTSLGDAVYRRMPNDTDLSVFLRRGIGGFNLAITSGSAAYHAPHDTPANQDPRSLQHAGECALELVTHLGELDLGSLEGPDATFFDLLGRGLVVYSRAWDVAAVLLGFALAGVVLAHARPRPRLLVEELALQPLECAIVAALLCAAWLAVDRAVALFAPAPGWVAGNATSGTLVPLGLTCLVSALVARRGAAREERAVERSTAALLWLAAAALGAVVWLPGATFVFSWPLVLAGAGQLALARRERAGLLAPALLVLAFAGALLLDLPILHLLFQLFQRTPDHALAVCAAVLAFMAGPFGPQLAAIRRAGPATSWTLTGLGSAALLAAIAVARVLGWRQGAFLP